MRSSESSALLTVALVKCVCDVGALQDSVIWIPVPIDGTVPQECHISACPVDTMIDAARSLVSLFASLHNLDTNLPSHLGL